MFITSFISSFMMVSFSWSLGYFCMYERRSEVGKWNGVIWYLIFMSGLAIGDLLNLNFYLCLLVVILTVLLTPLEKFPNGHHYVQNISNQKI